MKLYDILVNEWNVGMDEITMQINVYKLKRDEHMHLHALI